MKAVRIMSFFVCSTKDLLLFLINEKYQRERQQRRVFFEGSNFLCSKFRKHSLVSALLHD